MIILDTNVLSVFLLARPDPAIAAWLDSQQRDMVWITSVTIFEIRFGIDLLPNGKRKEQLEHAFQRTVREAFAQKVLSFDEIAAHIAGELAAKHKKSGKNIDIRDTQIAGIALSCRATLATRNVRHFKDTGVKLVNPWA